MLIPGDYHTRRSSARRRPNPTAAWSTRTCAAGPAMAPATTTPPATRPAEPSNRGRRSRNPPLSPPTLRRRTTRRMPGGLRFSGTYFAQAHNIGHLWCAWCKGRQGRASGDVCSAHVDLEGNFSRPERQGAYREGGRLCGGQAYGWMSSWWLRTSYGGKNLINYTHTHTLACHCQCQSPVDGHQKLN